MSRNKITVSEWCEAVGQIEKLSTEVPKGFKTMRQIAKELGRTLAASNHLVRELMNQGKVEMRKILIPTAARGLYPTPHYRIKSKG